MDRAVYEYGDGIPQLATMRCAKNLAELRAPLASRLRWCETWGMDSLQEILGKRDYTPPNEIEAIKSYIYRRYKSRSRVRLQRDALIVSVPSSALAATLQLERNRLIEACSLTKKLVIRTG